MHRLRTVTSLDVSAVAGHHAMPAALLLLLLLSPEDWHKAVIIPIPKPGKDKTEATNYRPIALTSCICKTMERMINDRLVWFLESI